MNRRKGLVRKVALRQTVPLTRRVGLQRKAGLKSRAIKASRPKVSSEERAGKKVARARSGGICEACGERRAAHWHHRVNKGQGGGWAPQNGMHVCVECHAWIGDYPNSAGVLGWHLKPNADPAVEPLRYRGLWVVLRPDDQPPTPTPIPEKRRGLAANLDRIRSAA
ncbi:hypothetical protein [Actinophytocola sp.]|uniref:hypothetical protein n=1 Tax=Actinophytocola sp. TaxID=1872138 RepID=UPI002D313E98|nr:hypothetical protein [Actinophytocola sp.]HYQ69652.1 hypothetical protein [Actinophytocola sp.]